MNKLNLKFVLALTILFSLELLAVITDIPEKDKFQPNDFRQLQGNWVALQDFTYKTMTYQLNILTPGFVRRSIRNIRTYDDKKPNVYPRSNRKWKEGVAVDTGRNLDFVVEGQNKAFFIIQLTDDKKGYTRDGRFRVDYQGRLVTVSGNFPVLGKGGVISVKHPSDITISRSGMIYEGQDKIDQFDIMVLKRFSDLDNLYSLNGVVFLMPDHIERLEGPKHYRVIQGMVRQSNSFMSMEGWYVRSHFKATKNAYDSLIHVRKKIGGVVSN